jgi:hypothetical protein
MRLGRCAARAALLLGAVTGTAVPARAAAPDYDTYAVRTVIGSAPFSQTLDTSEATTDTDDAAISAPCLGFSAFDASVWYEVTPARTGPMTLDISQADYSVGAIVGSGGPGNCTKQDCNTYRMPWSAVAGVTYTILVF